MTDNGERTPTSQKTGSPMQRCMAQVVGHWSCKCFRRLVLVLIVATTAVLTWLGTKSYTGEVICGAAMFAYISNAFAHDTTHEALHRVEAQQKKTVALGLNLLLQKKGLPPC
jgi:uncharacterized membrane protein (DUF4010 family)